MRWVFICSLLQKKPLVEQSLGASPETTPPPETRLSASHVSVENSLSNSSNVVCTGEEQIITMAILMQ